MKSVISGQRSVVSWRQILVFCLLITACGSLSCGSLPSLEAPECTASRQTVKELYSYHFGGEMRFSPENLKQREKYLTPELYRSLQNAQGEADVLTTGNTDYPKAFRVGKCEVVAPEKTSVELVLFWKTDTRTEQKEISLEVVRQGERWLVNKITN